MVDAVKKYRLIASNPLDGVEAPKATKYKASVLNTEEIQLLFKALEGNLLEIPIKVMYFLSLRRGELLGLKWEDIDYKNKTITIQRNLIRGGDEGTELILTTPKIEGSNRTIVLSDNIIDLLKVHNKAQEN
nr:site-specific integrase [Tissierella simiarum]